MRAQHHLGRPPLRPRNRHLLSRSSSHLRRTTARNRLRTGCEARWGRSSSTRALSSARRLPRCAVGGARSRARLRASAASASGRTLCWARKALRLCCSGRGRCLRRSERASPSRPPREQQWRSRLDPAVGRVLHLMCACGSANGVCGGLPACFCGCFMRFCIAMDRKTKGIFQRLEPWSTRFCVAFSRLDGSTSIEQFFNSWTIK